MKVEQRAHQQMSSTYNISRRTITTSARGHKFRSHMNVKAVTHGSPVLANIVPYVFFYYIRRLYQRLFLQIIISKSRWKTAKSDFDFLNFVIGGLYL